MTAVAGTRPYAWPFDGRLAGGHLALVLAGWDAGWSARALGPDVSAPLGGLTEAVARAGGLVVRVAHGAPPCPLPSPIDEGAVADVVAAGLDAFYGSPIDSLLRARGRTHLLVAGHGLEGPVHSTLRSANDRGYECLLVVDACTSLAPELAVAAGETVTMSGGIFGAIGSAAAVVDALAALP